MHGSCPRFSGLLSCFRPDKVSLGTSLEEALVYRYVLCAECQMAAQNIPSVEIANNPTTPMSFLDSDEAEYSGAPFRIELFTTPRPKANSAVTDSVSHHQRCGPLGAEVTLKRLTSASVALAPVFRALRGGKHAETAPLWPHPGGTLGLLLPKLAELDLSGCLLTRWIDVAEVSTFIF